MPLSAAAAMTALGRAADADQHVDTGVGPAGGDGAEDVAVADQLHAGAAANAPRR
jgi:hypothetical protein